MDGSGFRVRYNNCQHISFSFNGIWVVGSLCVFCFVPLGPPSFFDTFRLVLYGVDNYCVEFGNPGILVWCKVTLVVPSP